MSKDLRYTILFDVYGALLTDKQRETLELYYNDDLSLGEISEETGITRQGVMNCVRISERRLGELEEQLGLVGRLSELEKLTDELEKRLEAFADRQTAPEIYEIIDEIREKL